MKRGWLGREAVWDREGSASCESSGVASEVV